jgi:Domain of unknown function (DUF4082)
MSDGTKPDCSSASSGTTWSESDGSGNTLAVVNAGGLATGQAAGAVTISATNSGQTGTASLMVNAASGGSFFPTQTPTSLGGADKEVGQVFTSDSAGTIAAIKFYKGSASNNGTHIGSIWKQVAKQERVRLAERTRAGLERVRRSGVKLGRPAAKVDGPTICALRAQGESWSGDRASYRLGAGYLPKTLATCFCMKCRRGSDLGSRVFQLTIDSLATVFRSSLHFNDTAANLLAGLKTLLRFSTAF